MSELEILELGWKRAEELGLEAIRGDPRHSFGSGHYNPINLYQADDIHRLLGSGRAVRGAAEPVPKDVAWQYENKWDQYDDHQALLIGIKPIAKDTAESLLMELCKSFNEVDAMLLPKTRDFIERARALLGEKP